MTLTESMVEAADLYLLVELGYAVLPGPQLAPGEPAAERKTLIDMALSGRLCETIRQLNAATCKALKTTVLQPATVQSSSWLNP